MSMPLLTRLSFLAAVLLAACATPSSERPVLYPNAAYKAMGEAAARQHLEQCVALARQSGLHPSDNMAASGAARGAAVAGVSGAVGSLVFGRGGLDDAVRRGAQGAVVGAAAGGTAGAMSERPSSTYRQFVQRCAAEKGLDVIGWN
ncbi:MAG: glycine zipper family protein [Limnohabitans sp.]